MDGVGDDDKCWNVGRLLIVVPISPIHKILFILLDIFQNVKMVRMRKRCQEWITQIHYWIFEILYVVIQQNNRPPLNDRIYYAIYTATSDMIIMLAGCIAFRVSFSWISSCIGCGWEPVPTAILAHDYWNSIKFISMV